MRKLTLVEHISMDGIIQANDSSGNFPYGDWTAPYRSPAGLAILMQEYGERFDLVLGRKTYDLWSKFWPSAPPSPMGDRLKAATKFIVTNRPDSLEWGPFEAIGANFLDEIQKIKNREGPDLILCGSSTLTSQILERGIADDILLMVNPVFLGIGKRFFAEETPAQTFKLERTQSSPTGILINRYKFVGPLPKA